MIKFADDALVSLADLEILLLKDALTNDILLLTDCDVSEIVPLTDCDNAVNDADVYNEPDCNVLKFVPPTKTALCVTATGT